MLRNEVHVGFLIDGGLSFAACRRVKLVAPDTLDDVGPLFFGHRAFEWRPELNSCGCACGAALISGQQLT
jgi:hypothetical protein